MAKLKLETIYSTKYWLTRGIEKVAADVTPLREGNRTQYAYYQENPSHNSIQLCGEGKEWHRTYLEAVTRANVLKAAHIKSLENQLRQVRDMIFMEPK